MSKIITKTITKSGEPDGPVTQREFARELNALNAAHYLVDAKLDRILELLESPPDEPQEPGFIVTHVDNPIPEE